jgi:S1-C subfamily serine protease
VPGFFWDQSGRANYFHTHHTQYDTFDAAVPEYQKHSSVVIATGALGLANLPALLTRENMKTETGFRPPPGQRLLGVTLSAADKLLIGEVAEDSIALKAGIKPGDVVVKLGGKEVANQDELRAAMRDGPVKTTVTVLRDGKELTFAIQFAK